jgi:MFS family permease
MGVLGSTQILGFATTYYLPAVLAAPIARETGWALGSVVAGLSLGFLVAGFSAPWVGRLIDRFGGRPVLSSSSILLAAGLVLVGLSPNLIIYFLAWCVLGLGMSAGLYDAAFATLARLFGADARGAMTGLTLIGGFASTLGWPVISGLESQFGWQVSCFLLAGVHVLVGLPLHWLGVPREEQRPAAGKNVAQRGEFTPAQRATSRLFILVGVLLTVQALVASSLSVHLLDILRQLGIAAATALTIGMLLGPSQVAARLMEYFFGRLLHPTWSTRIGVLLCLLGIILLVPAELALAFVAVAIYGAGIGILTVAKGTLPLALFGSEGYGARMGLLARPMLLAQACGPVVAALVLDEFGAAPTLIILGMLISAGVVTSWCLPSSRVSSRAGHPG